MVASLFQLHGLFWATLGLSFVVTGMDSTESNKSYQKPDPVTYLRLKRVRFIAARRGAAISFSCFSDPLANWYKETENGKRQELMNNSRIQMTRNDSVMMMQIRKLQHVDNGIYFCERNNSYRDGKMQSQRCGTELRVMGVSTFEQVQNRHTLKDAIIVIQTILLVLFLSMPLLLTTGKMKSDAVGTDIYEGGRYLDDSKGESKKASVEDHTYEGLTVELADTYEDITTYQDTAQKWDLGEHPCEE